MGEVDPHVSQKVRHRHPRVPHGLKPRCLLSLTARLKLCPSTEAKVVPSHSSQIDPTLQFCTASHPNYSPATEAQIPSDKNVRHSPVNEHKHRSEKRDIFVSRREFLKTAGAAGGGALLLGSVGSGFAKTTSLPGPNKSGIDHIVLVTMENR